MKYIYPAIFCLLDNGHYYIEIPDLPNCQTEGKNLQDAYEMAQNVIAMWICDSEDHKEAIPRASDIHQIHRNAPDFVSLIAVDTTQYRACIDNKAVKKTLSIPSWMNKQAEEQGVNFSQVLQNALRQQLNMDSAGLAARK